MSTLKTLLIVSLIVLSTTYTRAQICYPRPVIVKLIEDAYKSREKDTIITVLEGRVSQDSVNYFSMQRDFRTLERDQQHQMDNIQQRLTLSQQQVNDLTQASALNKKLIRRLKFQKVLLVILTGAASGLAVYESVN